LNDTTKP